MPHALTPDLADDASTRSLRVMLADDNLVHRLVITRLLEKLGHTVELADDRAAAQASCQRQPPDLVLVALRAPGAQGLALAQALRNDEQHGPGRPPESLNRRLPIVGMADDRGDVLCAAALRGGIDACLRLPVDIARLARILALCADQTQSGLTQTATHYDARRLIGALDADLLLIEKVATLFKTSSARNLNLLKRALAQGDLPQAEFAAHGLRGTLSMLGAGQASDLAQSIESQAATGDTEALRTSVPAFEQALTQVSSVLACATLR